MDHFVPRQDTPAVGYLASLRKVSRQLGSLEKGKFADIIAVSGNPLQDVREMERVRFVMKGGVVMRDELTTAAPRRE